MIDKMNECIQHSKYEGRLSLQSVPGLISGSGAAENRVAAGSGSVRTMYAYAPKSGCPHPQQCQILMVLRNDDSLNSAQKLMEEWQLQNLAEDRNFLLLFPNPLPGGWNYYNDPSRESDIEYLIRCFAVLRGSELGIAGFNGMVFYLAASEEASALLMTMASQKPLHVPAMMISSFPEDYAIPADALHVETAAFVSENEEAFAYFMAANGLSSQEPEIDGVTTYYGSNPNVRLLNTRRPIGPDTIMLAWDRLFSETRRWRNDTFGCYQRRTNFTERGFVGHVHDSSLGCNHGHPQTWYEYIPPALRGTREKVPLLFYFHGGECVPLYAAEQSGWHDVADRENFIVIYPEASEDNAWNSWNDLETLTCSDREFMLALIDHIDTVHPIDRSRVYISGFSSGGMMCNAMACALPDVIAAAAPCDAYNHGYFNTYDAFHRYLDGDRSALDQISRIPTPVRQEADAKKAAYDYRVPVFQTVGLLDGVWPVKDPADNRLRTFDYWKTYNHIHTEPFIQNPGNEAGLHADEAVYEGEDERFLHLRWFSNDEGHNSLYELLLTKRCPHALDIRTTSLAWNYLKQFSRCPDGSLQISGEE